MKEQRLKLSLVKGVIALFVLSSAAIPAISRSDVRVEASVPFDFFVGNERLPTGDYTIGAVRTALGALSIRNNDEGTSLIALTQTARTLNPKEKTVLLFHRYNDAYFLYRIWVKGENAGYEVPKSRTERSIEKDLGRSPGNRATVVETVIVTAS